VELLGYLETETSVPAHIRTGGRRQVRADAELVRLLHHGVDQCSSRATRLKLSADAEHAQVHVRLVGVTGTLDLLAPQDLGDDGEDERQHREDVKNQIDPAAKALGVYPSGGNHALTPTSELSKNAPNNVPERIASTQSAVK